MSEKLKLLNATECIPPISFGEFGFAIGIMNAAASLTMVVKNPELQSVTLYDDATGESELITLRDTPLNRMLAGLFEHFEEEKCYAITLRWFALVRVAKHAQVGEWVKSTENGIELGDPLIHAAAQAELIWPGKKGNFKLREIVRLAREAQL